MLARSKVLVELVSKMLACLNILVERATKMLTPSNVVIPAPHTTIFNTKVSWQALFSAFNYNEVIKGNHSELRKGDD